MATPIQPKINLRNDPNFREDYANSVQIRPSLWDFLITFGRLQQQTEQEVEIMQFQSIYLSPQQTKALSKMLQHHVAEYERAFGEIKLDPQQFNPAGAVN